MDIFYAFQLSLSFVANIVDTLGKGINKISIYSSDIKTDFYFLLLFFN